jgi:hypothetical protein
VSGAGGTTVLVANAYAAMVAVSCTVVVVNMGAGGKVVAVANAGAAAEANMGAVVTGAVTAATAAATDVAATAVEGDVDSEAATTEGGGVACGGGAGCQGWGSCLNLASRALLASTLQSSSATMPSMRHNLASSIIIGVVAAQEKKVVELGEPRTQDQWL